MSRGTKALGMIVGRMGSDIQVRTNNNKKIGQLRLAVDSGYGDRATTSWFDVVIFDEKKIQTLEAYTAKGSKVMAIGELRVRKWTKDGIDRYVTELIVAFEGSIELMDAKGEGPAVRGQAPARQQDEPRAPPAGFGEDLDDDVPF